MGSGLLRLCFASSHLLIGVGSSSIPFSWALRLCLPCSFINTTVSSTWGHNSAIQISTYAFKSSNPTKLVVFPRFFVFAARPFNRMSLVREIETEGRTLASFSSFVFKAIYKRWMELKLSARSTAMPLLQPNQVIEATVALGATFVLWKLLKAFVVKNPLNNIPGPPPSSLLTGSRFDCRLLWDNHVTNYRNLIIRSFNQSRRHRRLGMDTRHYDEVS